MVTFCLDSATKITLEYVSNSFYWAFWCGLFGSGTYSFALQVLNQFVVRDVDSFNNIKTRSNCTYLLLSYRIPTDAKASK